MDAGIKYIIDVLIAAFEASAAKEHKLCTVFADDKKVFFCNTDFDKLAKTFNCEIKEAPRDSESYNTELYFIYRDWKMFTIINKEGATNAEV